MIDVGAYFDYATRRIGDLFIVRSEDEQRHVLRLKTAQKVVLIALAVIFAYVVVGPMGVFCFVVGACYGSSKRLQKFIGDLFTLKIVNEEKKDEPKTPRKDDKPKEATSGGFSALYAAIGDRVADFGYSFSPKKKD